MPTVLVVDDEPSLRDLLKFNLVQAGFDVLLASEGGQAQALALQMQPDPIVLDGMLPHVDGITICQRLRRDDRTSNVPILMLTARRKPKDLVVGFTAGADDYLKKPFQLEELLARVKALLRHRRKQACSVQHAEILTQGPLTLVPERYEVLWFDTTVKLTRSEFAILSLLMQRHGEDVSKRDIVREVWGYEHPKDGTDSARVHIRHLRQKLELNPKSPQYLKSICGVGYCLVLPRTNQH
ncbi:MAG: response regulator transcription factor [Synechococcus sp.]